MFGSRAAARREKKKKEKKENLGGENKKGLGTVRLVVFLEWASYLPSLVSECFGILRLVVNWGFEALDVKEDFVFFY